MHHHADHRAGHAGDPYNSCTAGGQSINNQNTSSHVGEFIQFINVLVLPRLIRIVVT